MVFAILLMPLPDAEVDIDAIMPSCYMLRKISRKIPRKISIMISNKFANSIGRIIKTKLKAWRNKIYKINKITFNYNEIKL